MVHKAAFPGKTCLISTANALYGELIDSALQQIGMSELHGASDIEDAIRRASVVAFDVIICADAEMNLALDMMHRIRKASPRSPVIIVTSQVSSEYLATVAEEGAAFVVAMPINTRKLLKTLNRAINEKRAPAARPPEHRPGPPSPSAPPPVPGCHNRPGTRGPHRLLPIPGKCCRRGMRNFFLPPARFPRPSNS